MADGKVLNPDSGVKQGGLVTAEDQSVVVRRCDGQVEDPARIIPGHLQYRLSSSRSEVRQGTSENEQLGVLQLPVVVFDVLDSLL